jgi:tetratricopeptide (TPR) repeat protein
MKKISFWPIWDEIQEVRLKEWNKKAIEIANYYIWKNPFDIQPYLQLMDIYYVMWELGKAEKPVDFILSQKLSNEVLDLTLMYYIKAVLLSERTEWMEAKKYIKLALKNSNNPEYKRLFANIEFWSWNKTQGYFLLQEIINEDIRCRYIIRCCYYGFIIMI